MTKEDKVAIVKRVLVDVLTAVYENFPWLDCDNMHVGRSTDFMYDKNNASVRIYFQTCTDAHGEMTQGMFSYKNAVHGNEMYDTVGQKLSDYFKGTPYIQEIRGGTYRQISDVPEWKPPLNEPHYGIEIDIVFDRDVDPYLF